jgi:hypothetical protein
MWIRSVATYDKRLIFSVICAKAQYDRLERGMLQQTLPVLGGFKCEEPFCV